MTREQRYRYVEHGQRQYAGLHPVENLTLRASLVVLSDSGHLPWLDDPKTIGQATVDFRTATG